jgi:hypothetical protein
MTDRAHWPCGGSVLLAGASEHHVGACEVYLRGWEAARLRLRHSQPLQLQREIKLGQAIGIGPQGASRAANDQV